jgi:hypothetical protein
MSKIIFDSGIYLDGFFAGDNRKSRQPYGWGLTKNSYVDA